MAGEKKGRPPEDAPFSLGRYLCCDYLVALGLGLGVRSSASSLAVLCMVPVIPVTLVVPLVVVDADLHGAGPVIEW
jgi:hypothetical protein